jgi:D-alanine-D-alanine ligase
MMAGKLRLGIIFGGRSGEHEVSLRSARSVVDCLDRERYEIAEIGITKEGKWLAGSSALEAFEAQETGALVPVALPGEPGRGRMYSWQVEEPLQIWDQIDVIFPVLHGTYCEDGTIQGLLELADIPYVGAGVVASAVAMDKDVFKQVMRAKGIPVVDWVMIPTTRLETDLDSVLDEAESISPYPLFSKPANLGSSVGISRCDSRSDLMEGILFAAQYDRRVIVEEGLDAREIEVSVLGNEDPQASVPGEIIPGDAFYSYEAKYIHDTSKLLIPAPIDDALAARSREIAVEAYRAIDGAGMARVDFLLERGSEALYLNEINTIPGFTSISMYPKLWEASGLEYADLLNRLVDLAIQRQAQKDRLVRSYGAQR